jgi:hypothetical protein
LPSVGPSAEPNSADAQPSGSGGCIGTANEAPRFGGCGGGVRARIRNWRIACECGRDGAQALVAAAADGRHDRSHARTSDPHGRRMLAFALL